MAQKNIDFGSFPDDPSADAIRTAFQKTQDNFTELYNTLRQTGVISLNRTPGAGVSVNQPTGNVILQANIANIDVRSTSLILNIGSPGNRDYEGNTAVLYTQTNQRLYIDLPNNMSVSNTIVLPTLSNVLPGSSGFMTSNITIPGGANTEILTTDGTGNVFWGPKTGIGTSGFSGLSGSSGLSGFSGFSGSSGFSGYSGPSGYSGFSGSSGVSGFSGYAGPTDIITAINDTTTTALYPVMVNTVGSPATAKVSTSKIYFNAVTGTIYATSKSFNIPHPTQPGKKLIYGSLEGPENGVYLRGRLKGNVIELPDYWSKLVDVSTTTVQLTSIGSYQKLYVKSINETNILVDVDGSFAEMIDCYFTVFAERKDIDKLQIVV